MEEDADKEKEVTVPEDEDDESWSSSHDDNHNAIVFLGFAEPLEKDDKIAMYDE